MSSINLPASFMEVVSTDCGPHCPPCHELSGLTYIDARQVGYLAKNIGEVDDNEAPHRLDEPLEVLVENALVLLDHFSWPLNSSLRRRLRNILRAIIKSAAMEGSGLNARAPEELHKYFRLTPDREFFQRRQLEMLEQGEVPEDLDLAKLGLYRRERLYERLLLCPLDPLFHRAPGFRSYIPGLLKGVSLMFGKYFEHRCEQSLRVSIGASKLQMSWWDEEFSRLRNDELRQLKHDMLVRAALSIFSGKDHYVDRLHTIINDEQQRCEQKSLSKFKLHKLLNLYFSSLQAQTRNALAQNKTLREALAAGRKLPSLGHVFLSRDKSMLEVSSHVVQVILQSVEAEEQAAELSQDLDARFGSEIRYNPLPKAENFGKDQHLDVIANFFRIVLFLDQLGHMGLQADKPSAIQTVVTAS